MVINDEDDIVKDPPKEVERLRFKLITNWLSLEIRSSCGGWRSCVCIGLFPAVNHIA